LCLFYLAESDADWLSVEHLTYSRNWPGSLGQFVAKL
jgi:hypothetical protein